MSRFQSLLMCIFVLSVGPSHVESNEVSVYFSNDSMNGLRLSDAYETHDMGIKYVADHNSWYDLNLAVVSPDMYVYRNEYREANRSYGEIIQLSFGTNLSNNYCKIAAIGKFGLDAAQDFAHRIFRLQPVAKINELVRMPDQVHVGCGISYSINPWDINIRPYIGTDRASLTADTKFQIYESSDFSLSGKFGFTYVGYDEIVSAEPISAEHRQLIPDFSINANYAVTDKIQLSVSERASLPTIAKDDSIFIQFSARLTYAID